jgi:hypothetical protein
MSKHWQLRRIYRPSQGWLQQTLLRSEPTCRGWSNQSRLTPLKRDNLAPPLGTFTRASMESRFSHDFSFVRVQKKLLEIRP